jgi:hypothetical protein
MAIAVGAAAEERGLRREAHTRTRPWKQAKADRVGPSFDMHCIPSVRLAGAALRNSRSAAAAADVAEAAERPEHGSRLVAAAAWRFVAAHKPG